MKGLVLYIFCLFISLNLFSQEDKASIKIMGETQKRVDKYTKTYKLRKKFDTESLENVSISVHQNKSKVLKSNSDNNGLYNISFSVEPNKNYKLTFSKNGYYSKVFSFNTNGINNHKEILFEGWNFHLYKRVIGLSDSVFSLPTKFYYDSERGFMTYDEGYNVPLEASQSEIYFQYLNNLNENTFIADESNSKSYSIDNFNNEKDTTEIEEDEDLNEIPKIHLIDLDKLLSEIKVSKQEKNVIERTEKEISNEWQKLELAKTKATSVEDRSKILEAQKLLLEKEQQIDRAKDEIEKANKQIEIQKLENQSKNSLLIFSFSILALVSSLLFVLYRNSKEKVKTNLLLKEQNKEIIDSIKYAQRIQNAILPPPVIINQNLKQNFILYMPKDIVSGDFYFVENFGDTTLFAVVDCTGHGVPGAFMSIVAYNALNQAVHQHKLTKPSEILNQVNLDISKTLHQAENIDVEDGMDLSLCKLNIKDRTLEFAGAQHTLNLVRGNNLETIKGNKFSVGSKDSAGKEFTNHEFKLDKDDFIYIFSDGYADQFGGENERKFMYKRLRNLLLANKNESLEQQKSILIKELNEWKGEIEQVDDICVMGVKIA